MPKDEDIICDPDALEGDGFIGEIVGVNITKRDVEVEEDGDTTTVTKRYIVLEIQADFADEPREYSIPVSNKKEALWGKFIKQLKSIGVTIKKAKDLEGGNFKFEYQNVKTARGFELRKSFPMPVEVIKKK